MKRALIYTFFLLSCGKSAHDLTTSLTIDSNLKEPNIADVDMSHNSGCWVYEPSKYTNSNIKSSDGIELRYSNVYKSQNQTKIVIEGCKGNSQYYLTIDIVDSSFVVSCTSIGEHRQLNFTTIEQDLSIKEYPINYGDKILGLLSYKGIALNEGSKFEADFNGMFCAIVTGDTSVTYHSISEGISAANYVQKLKLIGMDEINHIGQFKNLKQLDMTDRTYSGEFPEPILNLSHLEKLRLSCNITHIPDQIDKLTNLKSLDFWGNDALNELPSSLSKCLQLRELNLRQNNQIIITTLQGLDNLNYLNLAETNLSKLPEGLINLKNLEILDLSGNTKLNFTSTLSDLSNLKYLVELELRYCDLKILPSSLTSLKNLKKLNLSWNPITESELQRIKCEMPNTEIVFFTEQE